MLYIFILQFLQKGNVQWQLPEVHSLVSVYKFSVWNTAKIILTERNSEQFSKVFFSVSILL